MAITTPRAKNETKDAFAKCLMTSAALNQNVGLFEFGNVLVQKNYLENDAVRIVSGGSYVLSEFVGRGMLTCTIQGEQYMAPPSKLILRSLRELCYNHVTGCLIIIPANSGNSLNFGLAVTRALNDRLNVNLLTLKDAYNPGSETKLYQKGLSAIVLIAKIAGAMSEMKHSLSKIYTFCNTVMENIVSVGLKLHKQENDTICICNKMRYNKPDLEKQQELLLKDDYCQLLIDEISNAITQDRNDTQKLLLVQGDNLVLLLNNNGTLTNVQELLCVKRIVEYLSSTIRVTRIYLGNFVDCLDGINFTATLLKIHDKQVLEFLDSSCAAPGWRQVYQHKQISLDDSIRGVLIRRDRLAPPIRGPKLAERNANILLFSVQFACDAVISCQRQLNIMDSDNGDGDTGTRLKNAAEVIMKRAKQCKLTTNVPFTFFESLSKILEGTVGGTLGCIYSILFEAVSLCFGELPETFEITAQTWLDSLQMAAGALKKYGNVKYGDGTMYDPIQACCTAVSESFKKGSHFIEAFGNGVSNAEEVAQLTKKGKRKFPNPGAHAVGIWMRAVYECVKLRCPVDEL